MKKCLCATAVFLLFGWGVACGDLSEIEDDRIRDFVRTAKRVIIDELMTDGNTQDEIDDKIDVIVEAIKGNSGNGGITNPPLEMPACRETGRKTVVMFRDPAGHISDYIDDPSGFTCEISENSAICSDGDICTCEADDTMNPAGNTSFSANCTEDGGSGDTFNFTAAETSDYNAPSSGNQPPPSSTNAGTYRIEEQNQNQKNPGIVFPITVIDSRGTTVQPAAQASLTVYNSSDSEIDDALAMWKTSAGDNIYDVDVAAGVSASFDVFLVRDTSGVAKIGGTVDGTPIDKVTLTAGNYSGASDVQVFNNNMNGINFMFSGAARTALNGANKAMAYVITNANGEVQESATVSILRGLDIPVGGTTTFVGTIAGVSCVVGEYVLIRIGNNVNKVYLPRCKAAL